ncbi:glycosyltransferase [Nocardioides sp.]|uniref:glycosyltransferase n=1 Tax=Nocardioides sp. TaxID=35761 RepID=UPI0031FEAFAE|nr:glycosyl transferase, family 2 [Nocardioides sp.]
MADPSRLDREVLPDLKPPILVLADVDLTLTTAGATSVRIGTPPPRDGGWASVVLVASDPTSLRRMVSVLPALGRARTIVCACDGATAPLSFVVRPEWPALLGLDASVSPDGFARTSLRFAKGLPVADVLVEIGRYAALPVGRRNAGVFLAAGSETTAPPVDPALLVISSLVEAADPELKVPPGVVLVPAGTEVGDLPPHPVLGRAPVVVTTDDDLTIGPLDEAVLNPGGFARAWQRGIVDLDPSTRVTPRLVAALRDAQGVRVSWPADERTVAGLAMAGVPLLAPGVPDGSRVLLGDALADAVEAVADLDEPLRREEHSVRIRRAALARHSARGWRARVAARAGVRGASELSVSVLLATRRPDNLDFALRQVARQRGAEVELVLAAHGFQPDAAQVRDALGDRPYTLLSLSETTVFGNVLRAASDAASGDVVVKMDDDDWYGPDVVADLLLARGYSGAELVGMPAEFVYLEPIRTTVRRRGASETHASVVAGGTMMIDRSLLRSVGGFRGVRRFADAQLLASVRAAGGSVYRTQGLGYLLRRTSAGHTWDAGLGYFLARKSLAYQWRGFRPSLLLEHDPADLP